MINYTECVDLGVGSTEDIKSQVLSFKFKYNMWLTLKIIALQLCCLIKSSKPFSWDCNLLAKMWEPDAISFLIQDEMIEV